MTDTEIIVFWTMASCMLALVALTIVIAYRNLREEHEFTSAKTQAIPLAVVPTPRLPMLKMLAETELIPVKVTISAGGTVRYEREEHTRTGRMRSMMTEMSVREAAKAGRDPHYQPKHRMSAVA